MLYKIISSLLIFMVFLTTSQAGNLNFLDQAPLSQMSSEDLKLLQTNIQSALNQGKDGESVKWSNPKTKNQGELTPLKTYQAHQTTCRALKIFTKTSAESTTSQFDFCLAKDKSWKVLK